MFARSNYHTKSEFFILVSFFFLVWPYLGRFIFLSTFFIGLSMKPACKADKWLKALLMVHGVFFIGCFIMPMTGVFSAMADGETSSGGVIALILWCVYFLPVGILAYRHFSVFL